MKAMMEVWGYKAMIALLKDRCDRQPSLSVRELLEELALDRLNSGSEAVREEWNAAVRAAMESAPDQMTQLHLL